MATDNSSFSHAIEARGLTKRFGAFTAVDHISFTVDRGEIFGFLGANGAGKTTAMRMLCGLSTPSGGSVKVAGVDVAANPEEVKRRIGYMSQRFSLYEELTVEENLRLFGAIYGLSRADTDVRVADAYRRLDMAGLARSRARDLPVGWRQKLAFVAATLHRPAILFLDEPTGGVDPVTRRRFWELIYSEASAGMTIFVTTHYLDEAEYCHRVSIMVDGRVVALDTPAALKARYGAETMDGVFRIAASAATRAD